MNRIKTFFYVLKNSLFDFSYYSDIKKAPFSFSLKYLATLILIVTAITSTAITYGGYNLLKPYLDSMEQNFIQVEQTFPANLALTFSKGVMDSSTDKPVVLGRKFTVIEGDKKKEYKGFITIDENAQVDSYEKNNTFMVLNTHGIIYDNELLNYPDSLNGTIDKQTLFQNRAEILNTIQFFKTYFPALLLVFVITAIVLIGATEIIAYLAMLVLLTLGSWVLARTFQRYYNFSTLYRMGMHALTPVILFSCIVVFIPQVSTQWSFLLYVAWMLGAITSVGKDKSVHLKTQQNDPNSA